MGPDVTDSLRVGACPSCGASVRADAQWCGQCYADFRPAPVPELPVSAPITPSAAAAYGVPAPDPLTQPLSQLLPFQPVPVEPAEVAPEITPEITADPASEPDKPMPTWPCLTCQAQNPLSEMVCSACGSPFLAAVSEAGRTSLVLPVVGDLGAMSRGKRLGLALAAVGALLVPLALITLLLTDSPPPQNSGPGSDVQVVQTTSP